MAIKWIGAIIVVTCCGGFGMIMAEKYRSEEKTLQSLHRILLVMESELRFRLTPLPELCKIASNHCEGTLKKVFCGFVDELGAQIAPDASVCMTVVLNRFHNIPPLSLEVLRLFGDTAGCFDLQGQLTGMEHLQNLCAQKLQQLSFNRDTRLRNYQTLGLCAGAALVILFI